MWPCSRTDYKNFRNYEYKNSEIKGIHTKWNAKKKNEEKRSVLVSGIEIRNVIQTSNNMLFMFPLLRHLYGLPSQFFHDIILSSFLFFCSFEFERTRRVDNETFLYLKSSPSAYMMLCHLTLCLRRWYVLLCCCYNMYVYFLWLILCRLLISMNSMFGRMLHERCIDFI